MVVVYSCVVANVWWSKRPLWLVHTWTTTCRIHLQIRNRCSLRQFANRFVYQPKIAFEREGGKGGREARMKCLSSRLDNYANLMMTCNRYHLYNDLSSFGSEWNSTIVFSRQIMKWGKKIVEKNVHFNLNSKIYFYFIFLCVWNIVWIITGKIWCFLYIGGRLLLFFFLPPS